MVIEDRMSVIPPTMPLTDGRNTLDKQEGDREGELSLALYAHRMHANGNVSRMFALGNSTMLVDDYIYQSTFNEQFLTAVLKELVPSGEISLDIMASSAFTASAKGATICAA